MTKRTTNRAGERRNSGTREEKPRRHNRLKAVLPVRVSGSDRAGNSYTDLVHTLDITQGGVCLGAVRRDLEVGDQLILQYRQHKAEFRVVWTTQLPKLKERHVGLEAVAKKDLWGLEAESKNRSQDSTADNASPQLDA